MKASVIFWGISIFLLFANFSALAADKSDDYVYSPSARPDKSHLAVSGSNTTEKGAYGPNIKRDDNYGFEGVNITSTAREYKNPVCNGTISAIGNTYVTITRKLGKSTFFHTFVINRRTKFTGDVRQGAAVSISYNVGAQKKANKVETTMTAIEVKVIGEAGLAAEDKKRDTGFRDASRPNDPRQIPRYEQ